MRCGQGTILLGFALLVGFGRAAHADESPRDAIDMRVRWGVTTLALGDQRYTRRAQPPGSAQTQEVSFRGRDVGLEHPKFMSVGLDLVYARRYFAIGAEATWGFAGAFDAASLDPQLGSQVKRRRTPLMFGEYAGLAELRVPIKPVTLGLGFVAGVRLTSVNLEGFAPTDECANTDDDGSHPCPPDAKTTFFFAQARVTADVMPILGHPEFAFGPFVASDIVPAPSVSLGLLMTIRSDAAWNMRGP
jgi:hypothetical protein